jgi:hypothetical protein
MSFAGISRPRLSAAGRWLAPALLIAMAPALARAAARAPECRELQADEPTQQAGAALSVLRDAAATQPQRERACKVLIELCELAQVRSGLSEILAGPLVGASEQFLAAIAKDPDAPSRLYPLVAQRLAAATPEETPRVIAALGSFRTRDAARLLGRYVGEDHSKAENTAAMAALARLSARDDLGQNRAAWAAWLREMDGLSESQWRLQLIASLASRNDRLASERHDAVSQLTDSLRKLHLATKAEDRPGLLASMLEDEIPAVRDLGFELVARELSANGHLDGAVGAAALRLLIHPQPSVRSTAAVLVRQLAPPGAEQAVAGALADETDPAAAADLLLAAARWPSPGVVAPVLRWLESGTPAGDAAAEAAWWLFRAGELNVEASDRVLTAIRRVPADLMSPAAISLLAALGNDDDRERLVPLLASSEAPQRQAAGEALLWYPQDRPAILAAAANDPDLFDIASRAVFADEPSADDLRALLSLPKPSPELTRAAVLRVAGRMHADDLRAVANEVADPDLKRALLTNLIALERVMSEKSAPVQMGAIARGVGDLAELELSQNHSDAALAVLDAATFADGHSDQAPRLAGLRCTALLALGRLDDAQHLEAGADCWLRGLAMASRPTAEAVSALEARFTGLTGDQKAALDTLKAKVQAQGPSAEVGPPPQ